MKPQHTPEPWNCGGLDYCPECGATGDYEELKQQRDALLAALRDIITAYRELACDAAEPVMHRIAVEAIAKARGQQS